MRKSDTFLKYERFIVFSLSDKSQNQLLRYSIIPDHGQKVYQKKKAFLSPKIAFLRIPRPVKIKTRRDIPAVSNNI